MCLCSKPCLIYCTEAVPQVVSAGLDSAGIHLRNSQICSSSQLCSVVQKFLTCPSPLNHHPSRIEQSRMLHRWGEGFDLVLEVGETFP